jgi:hypothetical protein
MIIDTLQHQVTVALSRRTAAAAASGQPLSGCRHTGRVRKRSSKCEAARWSKVLPQTGMQFD